MLIQRLILTFTSLLAISLASPGDTHPIFESCLAQCTAACPQTPPEPFEPLSPLLRLLAWDCESDCDYQCQQITLEYILDHDEEIVQFHGKWPFLRLLGTQELASVIFSMMNLVPHYVNAKRAYRKYKRARGGESVLYMNVTAVGVITTLAWAWSSIFHVRDLNWTETLDYTFAGLTVLSGFHYLVIRVLKLYNNPANCLKVTALCGLMFTGHCLRLWWDWSYTYNMQANVFVAVLQYSLFVVLSYQHYQRGSKRLAAMPIALIMSVLFGMSFEIFDFFSVSTQLDAHAIWHAVTVVPGWYLYEFFYMDIESLRLRYLD